MDIVQTGLNSVVLLQCTDILAISSKTVLPLHLGILTVVGVISTSFPNIYMTCLTLYEQTLLSAYPASP